MVNNCMVPGCSSRTRKIHGASFHRLPKELEFCKKWLRAVSNPRFGEDTAADALKNQMVCSLHFKPEDLEPNPLGMRRATLVKTAVPSVFTCRDDDDEQPGTSGTSGAKRISREAWLAAPREMDKQDLTGQSLICEDHFLPKDISTNGIASDAVPVMPPYLGTVSPWGADSSEEEGPWASGDGEDDDAQQIPEGTSAALRQVKQATRPKKMCRLDVSLVVLTQRFLELMQEAPGGSVDLGQVAMRLKTRRRRVYDITNVLGGINLVQKESASRIRWIGKYPICRFLRRTRPRLQRELENLKLVEATLDRLIKSCAQQLFDMTDDADSSAAAYVTHDDVSRLKAFQGQTVIAVRAPEETKLEIPVPTEDNIQVCLKAGRGPIKVLTCEPASCDTARPEQSSSFITLEKSRIRTRRLATGPQTAGRSTDSRCSQ